MILCYYVSGDLGVSIQSGAYLATGLPRQRIVVERAAMMQGVFETPITEGSTVSFRESLVTGKKHLQVEQFTEQIRNLGTFLARIT